MNLTRWFVFTPLAFFLLATPAATCHARTESSMTNIWQMASDESIDSISLVMAAGIDMNGHTHDDSFWVAVNDARLSGRFGNDVWVLASIARLTGRFSDHARVIAKNIIVDGTVSNGLWAIGNAVTITTNASLFGEQFLLSQNLSLQGHIEGDVYARASSITVGGTIVGNVRLYGDDIIVKPGTTVIGDLVYVTTNRSIVLDANSQVSGRLKKMAPPAAVSRELPPAWNAMLQFYLFLASLIVGIPFILIFPGVTGVSVRLLRTSLWKCGLTGIALMFGAPLLIVASAITVIGLPFALVFGAAYALVIYLGKFSIALLVGTALLNRRGTISVPIALLSLVTGLFLYYCTGMFPYVGASLQTTAAAFGAGSLILAMLAGRGNVRAKS